MTFQDDDQTVKTSNTVTVDNAFDVFVVKFQIRATEFDLIKNGTEADKNAFIEWLIPSDD